MFHLWFTASSFPSPKSLTHTFKYGAQCLCVDHFLQINFFCENTGNHQIVDFRIVLSIFFDCCSIWTCLYTVVHWVLFHFSIPLNKPRLSGMGKGIQLSHRFSYIIIFLMSKKIPKLGTAISQPNSITKQTTIRLSMCLYMYLVRCFKYLWGNSAVGGIWLTASVLCCLFSLSFTSFLSN